MNGFRSWDLILSTAEIILNHSTDRITIRQPDDWHVHLRDGAILEAVLPSTSRVFHRAVVMPNLNSPITSLDKAVAYRKQIENLIPKGHDFKPLMTLYLTDDISPDIINDGFNQGEIFAAKLYPANSTTNSSSGVTDIKAIDPLFAMMESIGMPLLIHGEVTDPDVDIFDREAIFIERELIPLLSRHQGLRVVLEHITTKDAVQFVEDFSGNLAATITPHHLHINRNAMLANGFRSDFYCLPVAKRELHRLALRRAATSGKECFFLGTDSAPHVRGAKESACGCAGIFNAPVALQSYAEVFDEEDALDRLEGFTSLFGPKFYRLPINKNFISLVKQTYIVPESLDVINHDNSIERIVPFHASKKLKWTLSV